MNTDIPDFGRLVDIYSRNGARYVFEKLVQDVVAAEISDAKGVRPNPGDSGIDAFIGTYGNMLTVFQSKFFLGGLQKSQKDQIRRSFEKVHSDRNTTPSMWILVIPKDMDLKEQKWFDRWKGKQDIRIDYWGASRLRSLLGKYPWLYERYFRTGPKAEQKFQTRVSMIGAKEFDIKSVQSRLEPLLDTRIRSVETRLDLWKDLRHEFPSLRRKSPSVEETDILLDIVDLAIRDTHAPEYRKVCIDILSMISSVPSDLLRERIKEDSDFIFSLNTGEDWDMRKRVLTIQRNISRSKDRLTEDLIRRSIHEWNEEEFKNLEGSIKFEELKEKNRVCNNLLRERSELEVEGKGVEANRAKQLYERLKRYLD